jgi:hypothetical protein
MTSMHITDPNHCLDLAKEARALAEFIDDPKAKRTMLVIADEYELAAKKGEQQTTGNSVPASSVSASRYSNVIPFLVGVLSPLVR